MPYSKDNLPEAAKKLPSKAKDIFIAAFNSAFKQYEGNEEKAFAVAWAAVKNKYRKQGDKWVEKSETDEPNIIELSMYITKASVGPNGEMLWAASASDTGKDYYDEQMSIELYRSFIKNFDKSPAGKVYVSLAHYGFLDGAGDGGTVESIYIDGKVLKAKGRFSDNELGRSIFESIRTDRKNDVEPEKRIRVSIGFYDYKHRHGDYSIWEFRSGNPCLLCKQGVKDKVYLEGVLEHLAVTRVPANKRTDIEVVENAVNRSEDMTTRQEDALSIVPEQIVFKLEEKSNNAPVHKSVEPEMVTKDENAPVADNANVQVTNSPVADVISAEEPKAEPSVDVSSTNTATTSPSLMEQLRQAKEIIADLENKIGKSEVTVDKAEEMVDKCEPETMWKPLGGATSFAEADAYMEAQKIEDGLYRAYSIFGALASNIMNGEGDVNEKLKMLDGAVAEFRNKLRPDTLMKMSQAEKEPDKSEKSEAPAETVQTPTAEGEGVGVEVPVYKGALDKISVILAGSLDKPTVERREMFQNALNTFTEELRQLDVTLETKSNSGIQEPENKTDESVATIMRMVEERNAELKNSVMAELAGIKELIQSSLVAQAPVTRKSNQEQPNGQPVVQPVPVGKAVFIKPNPDVFNIRQEEPRKPMSIRDIARATVYPQG